MKCTIFGDLVGKLSQLADNNGAQPMILVVQLFKPSVYLNETYIQNVRYVSCVLLKPDFPDVVAFRNSLMAQCDLASQQITQIEEHPDHSVGDELQGGALPLNSIEEVLNMTDVSSLFNPNVILCDEVSVGFWPVSCLLRVESSLVIILCLGMNVKLIFGSSSSVSFRYKLNIIVADGTGCLNLIVWNQERKLILGKSANEVRGEKAQPKIFETLLEKRFLFKVEVSSRNASSIDLGTNQSVSNQVPVAVSVEADSDLNAAAIVSLSKDSGTESNFGDGIGTPMKDGNGKAIPSADVSPLCNLDVQGSSSRTFRRSGGKRKSENLV
ncbi:hypothetical protein PIB30_024439 [Stylosanthes scabra]|uniref:Uncharacterized protein n=1 Tax=Stylosanthes scabra TaxID=79078 RepID=A0ABU6W7P7_9FABA|nr:hypothetical protein [Stylosanthes scabra]